MNTISLLRKITFFMAMLIGGPNYADIIPPDAEPCSGKSEGDACTTNSGTDGNCTMVKDGYCSYNPNSGKFCRDILKCTTNADAGQHVDASEQTIDNAQGCSAVSGNSLSVLSICFGAMIIFGLSRRKKRFERQE